MNFTSRSYQRREQHVTEDNMQIATDAVLPSVALICVREKRANKTSIALLSPSKPISFELLEKHDGYAEKYTRETHPQGA